MNSRQTGRCLGNLLKHLRNTSYEKIDALYFETTAKNIRL